MPEANIHVVIKRGFDDPITGSGRHVFVSPFDFGDKVKIDGGPIEGVVVGMCIYPHGDQIQVSWWNNGAVVEQWFASWRIASAD